MAGFKYKTVFEIMKYKLVYPKFISPEVILLCFELYPLNHYTIIQSSSIFSVHIKHNKSVLVVYCKNTELSNTILSFKRYKTACFITNFP